MSNHSIQILKKSKIFKNNFPVLRNPHRRKVSFLALIEIMKKMSSHKDGTTRSPKLKPASSSEFSEVIKNSFFIKKFRLRLKYRMEKY